MTSSSYFAQTVLSPDEQDAGNRSIDKAGPAYDGTWNRLGIVGKGGFGTVYCYRHAKTGKVRAVKEIWRGQSGAIAREIECMTRLRDVSEWIHPTRPLCLFTIPSVDISAQ